MANDLNPLSQRSAGDYTHTAVKAGPILDPGCRGAAAELFSLVLAPPIERRRDGFLEDLYLRLKQLEGQVKGFHLEDLQKNEAFVSAALQATRAAIGTNQQEKREYLRNALLNIAAGKDTDEIKQQIFLNAVEAFTPAHVKALNLIWRGASLGVRWDENRVPLGQRNYGAAIEIIAPEVKGQSSLIEAVLADLRNRGFSTLGRTRALLPARRSHHRLGSRILEICAESGRSSQMIDSLVASSSSPTLPVLVAATSHRAAVRFLEFFAANIRNPHILRNKTPADSRCARPHRQRRSPAQDIPGVSETHRGSSGIRR